MKPGIRNIVAFILAMIVLAPLRAELISRQGTYDGVYHRDRWGQGRFSFLLVAPELHARLKQYDGKPIRLECRSIEQKKNPGPGTVREIGAITPLDKRPIPIKVDFSFRVGDFPGKDNVEFVCRLTNQSQEPIQAGPFSVNLRLYLGPSSNAVPLYKSPNGGLFSPQLTFDDGGAGEADPRVIVFPGWSRGTS